MKHIVQTLFGLLLFSLPFGYRLLVYEEAAYRFGNFNPWVSGFFYLPEALLIIVFLLAIFFKIKDLRLKIDDWSSLGFLFLLFNLNALFVTFWHGDVVLGVFWLVRIAEACILFWLIKIELLPRGTMVRILLLGALFQIMLGVLQWFLNHSVGLWFFGESTFNSATLNVAKVDLAEGTKQVRAYGTFLHPNILAGYLLTIFFVSLDYLKRRSALVWVGVIGMGLVFAQSLAAFLAGGAAMFSKMQKRIGSILFLVLMAGNVWLFFGGSVFSFTDASVAERLEQNQISHDMLLAHPLGVGVGNFTLEMENFSVRALAPWEFQPVHNTYFLILNETGVQGFALFLAILFVLIFKFLKNKNAIPLFALLFLAPFDHFLWDSWSGLMLIPLVFGFLMLNNKPSETL